MRCHRADPILAWGLAKAPDSHNQHRPRCSFQGKAGARMLLLQISQIAQLIRNREEGQAMVEYALILSLVSIAAITILGIVGTDVVTVLTGVANALVPG